ncbi:MAG: penicillin-binding protein 2, partial [Candidatus Omnitrophica bacterium]|nr:penicillin-binding protein 2 [Candidatus Omnitrophota bacterium]
MARPTNDRIVLVLAISLGVLGLLWVRCVVLQVVDPHHYAATAATQQRAIHTLPAPRGAIFDRAGRPLAVSIPVPSVFANARQVTAKQAVAQELAKVVGKDAGMVQRRLEQDKGFVWIARQVAPTVAPALLSFRTSGVDTMEEPKRFYPQGRTAGHVLGFTDIDQRGLEGLELLLNGVLRGQQGWRQTLRDAKGDLLFGPWTTQTEPLDGFDLVLTIDSVVQQAAEETLAWGVKTYHAKGGSVIVMDPASGEILAMANEPSYDPNEPAQAAAEARRNRAVTDMFEPGSIFKIVTAAALLEEGRVSLEETFFCEQGSWPTVAGHILHDHTPHGLLSFHDVIRLSSNIGTAKAAQRLKPDELHAYIRTLGFGRKTGVDVPGEVGGMVPAPTRWWKVSMYNIPIGHGVAVTPIQLAVMTSVIANGGLRVQPHVVQRIQTADGRVVRPAAVAEPVRVLNPQTAATVQQMLRSVVESGTGQLANVQGLTV